MNAYVTGLGSTKRIVLWDTLLAELNQREVLFVMAHEMGHYVLNHVIQGISSGFWPSLPGCTPFIAWPLFSSARCRVRFGFSELSDIASLPLIVLLTSVMSLVLSPAVFAYSRYTEHEADRFGLELTQDNHAAATAFVKLQQENLGNPRPGFLYTFWRGSHPSLGDRIDFANTYRPWTSGQSGVKRGPVVASNPGNSVTPEGAGSRYYPGKQKAHVGQAFQPDVCVLSGWKA